MDNNYWLKIIDILRQPDNNIINRLDYLYHYTRYNGFSGIIQSGKLIFKFSRSDYMNDKLEGKHIERVFKDACDELLTSEEISLEFYSLIKDKKPSSTKVFLYRNPKRVNPERFWAFIGCFSLEENSPDMWKNYGNNGYVLKLDRNIYYDFQKELEIGTFYFYKVVYNYETQIAKIKEYISLCYDFFTHTNDSKSVEGLIIAFLSEYQFIFKSEEYAYENEYRFLIFSPENYLEEQLPKFPKVVCEERTNGLVHCVILECSNIVLESIIIDPSADDKVVDEALRSIKAKGFTDVDVAKPTD